jgi:hypothetical protein
VMHGATAAPSTFRIIEICDKMWCAANVVSEVSERAGDAAEQAARCRPAAPRRRDDAAAVRAYGSQAAERRTARQPCAGPRAARVRPRARVSELSPAAAGGRDPGRRVRDTAQSAVPRRGTGDTGPCAGSRRAGACPISASQAPPHAPAPRLLPSPYTAWAGPVQRRGLSPAESAGHPGAAAGAGRRARRRPRRATPGSQQRPSRWSNKLPYQDGAPSATALRAAAAAVSLSLRPPRPQGGGNERERESAPRCRPVERRRDRRDTGPALPAGGAPP